MRAQSRRQRQWFQARVKRAQTQAARVYAELAEHKSTGEAESRARLAESHAQIEGYLAELATVARDWQPLPAEQGVDQPKADAVARALASMPPEQIDTQRLISSLKQSPQHDSLTLAELWSLGPLGTAHLVENFFDAVTGDGEGTRTSLDRLRRFSLIDWRDVVEAVSTVELTLRTDPAAIYPRMDAATRNRYRVAVQQVERCCPFTEQEVAQEAIRLASAAQEPRRQHVGYWLLDDGLADLRRAVRQRPPLATTIRLMIRRVPALFYLGGVTAITALLTTLLIWLAVGPDWLRALLAVLMLPLTSEAAVGAMNQIVGRIFTPSSLPKLDFSRGIPEQYSTIVVVPTLLLNEKNVATLLEDLEIRYLANSSRQLRYALLTDFPDAVPSEEAGQPLLDQALRGIGQLNARHGRGSKPFYLFHRARVWNPSENAWVGHERKRGKLLQFNRLLRGETKAFDVVEGDMAKLAGMRYVITLDSDTQLPREAAAILIGTMAHPLNQPVIDPRRNVVVKGYGILQPRIGVSMQAASRSYLAQFFSGQTGIDPYTSAVSDVYQDLFGEGSFTGKGIYDVDVVRATLEDRFPDNSLLSHDLLEGVHARAGLATDIELIDDYPSQYGAYSKRKHRWVRGDWQILVWILPRVPHYNGTWVANPLSVISRWKILDNLRRSLAEVSALVVLPLAWLLLTNGGEWALAALALMLLPVYLQFVLSLLRPQRSWTLFRVTAWDSLKTLEDGHLTVLLWIVFLGHQAMLLIDAIGRAMVRRLFTKRKLLEWETAAQAEHGAPANHPAIALLQWSPPIAIALGAAVELFNRGSVGLALPVLLLWIWAPVLADWLNQPVHRFREANREQDRRYLRGLALDTWRYFIDFERAEDHWLIPDNVQEVPYAVARRISPTNLGLQLTAMLGALDLGHLTAVELERRLSRLLDTVESLDRYQGHWFNWYDTATLAVLDPPFVSSVDSGNLAACLLIVRQGLLDLLSKPLLHAALLESVRDHVRLIRELLDTLPAGPELLQIVGSITVLCSQPTTTGDSWQRRAERFHSLADELVESVKQRVAALPVAVRPTDGARLTQASKLLRARTHALQEAVELATQFGSDDATVSSIDTLAEAIGRQAARLQALYDAMRFRVLVNGSRKLLRIGVERGQSQGTEICYDRLASETRTASFLAIAKGDAPQESWFRLDRKLTLWRGETVMLSWSGTMFEYLMPLLFMRSYEGTLLDETMRAAVAAQRRYGQSRRVPWGISEAAYTERDALLNYRYHAFGVPGLGVKRGLSDRLVIAPYSTCLALMVAPRDSLANLRTMEAIGWRGEYGFYEAADYAQGGREPVLVRAYMAHHQGMSLMAIVNVLLDGIMQRRFHADASVQATELLLQERVPLAPPEAGRPDFSETVDGVEPGTTLSAS